MPDQADKKDPGQASFLRRWSHRKHASRTNAQAGKDEQQAVQQPPDSTQQCLPDIDSLHEGSDLGMFFAEDVSDTLRRQAFRKLFHFGKFNVCDGLDDYAEDYTIFKPLEKLIGIHDKLHDIGDKLQTTDSADFATEPSVPADNVTDSQSEFEPAGSPAASEKADDTKV